MDLIDNEQSAETKELLRRIAELEQQISAYEMLLQDLPELFERKFQQRLEPLLERYRLLEDRLAAGGEPSPTALLPSKDTGPNREPDNLVRFPGLRLGNLLGRRSA
ncbi:MAG: hypothetical protein VKI93_02110 [Synechococcus sp.]|nr:hypothetical protein [Synechococcus sp.]